MQAEVGLRDAHGYTAVELARAAAKPGDIIILSKSVNGQTKGRLGHKGMAFDHFKRCTGAIRKDLVIARDDIYLTRSLDADLA